MGSQIKTNDLWKLNATVLDMYTYSIRLHSNQNLLYVRNIYSVQILIKGTPQNNVCTEVS